jgi:PPE-repeat protein
VTAPIWMASPPEVHSALLSSGSGPGSLLAAAAAWNTLSTEYGQAADELAAVLGAVHAGAWEGPSAETYAAAHAPYLAWLLEQSAHSTAMAAEQEAAAVAYTAALAAMPTLGELAANHATHAVLAATNFFGINTIPIAVNEADYARMWVQAAAVMATYQGVAGAAVAAAPAQEPAPTIVKAAAATDPSPSAPPAWFEELQSYLEGLFPQPPYPNTGDFPLYQQIVDFFNQIGFTGIDDPIATWLQGLPSSWLPPVGVPGSWLAYSGNPLAYLNPASIAYILSVPLDPGSYVAFTGIVIADDLLAVVYTAAVNPQALILVAPLAFVEIVGSTIGNTVQVLHYVLDSTLAALPAILPLLAVSAAPLAIAPLGAAGLAGLAGLATPAPVATAPALAPAFAMAPSPPPAPALATPAPALAPVTAGHVSVTPPAPTPPPPTPAGPPSATMQGFMYMTGDLGLAARRAAESSARTRKKAVPDAEEIPAAAPIPEQRQPARRRRPAKTSMIGRGYEYMDLEPEPIVTASQRDAGRLGFTGSAASGTAVEPAGLALAADQFGGSSTVPMLPATWDPQLD